MGGSPVNSQEWAERDARGWALGSSVEFILPNGAARSPDACWIERSRVFALTREQSQRFAPLCPDFVVELTSPMNRLKKVQAKMREYIDNGAKLGWLLDSDTRTAYLYRAGRTVERLVSPEQLVGESPVAGFVLDLKEIWDPDW